LTLPTFQLLKNQILRSAHSGNQHDSQGDQIRVFFSIFADNAFISPFNTQTKHFKSFLYTTALQCFTKNLIPWWDSNPCLLVPEADAMSTAPRRQGYQISFLLAQ
jgi:hypothetical protein